MKKMLEARVRKVYWQEWPLDSSRTNRAERSTSNSQVDGRCFFVMYYDFCRLTSLSIQSILRCGATF